MWRNKQQNAAVYGLSAVVQFSKREIDGIGQALQHCIFTYSK